MNPLCEGRRLACALLSLCLTSVSALAQGVITQSEPNDSIGTATATGIAAGTTGIKVSYGNSGNGPFGELPGNETGDVDFFKISANAGQTIFVNMANAGIDPDFDAYAALYDSAGTKLIESDDKGNTSRGYDRTPSFSFKALAAGDYYVCVSNWVADTTSLPGDPLTAGTGPGLASGNSGPYQVIVGLDAEVPVPQFVGGSTGYPVPAFLPQKVFGTPRYDGVLTISNRSVGTTAAANDVITGYSVTGPDAARFTITGLVPPVTIPPGGELNVNISFNAGGSGSLAQAVLNLVSNDPLNQSFVLNTSGSPVVGGGLFSVKQVNAPAGTTVTTMETADQILDGTIAGGTTFNGTASGINYGAGAGHFGSDVPFLNGGTTPEQIVLQVTGTIRIRTAGLYSFMSYSDDGARLKVDGVELFSFNDANVDHFGSADLTAGNHVIEYTMFEGTGGNSAELAISQQPGEFTSYITSTWELLEAAGSDTDGDDLPDAYETANGLSPTSAAGNDGATGDPDGDGVSNIQEYVAGTNPQKADTDDDGLKDGVETGTGIWVSVTNTGTKALVADTDSDGLLDGVENPGLASTGASQPGSDPNKKDTDGDGYADLSEVTLGTNPKLASSVPSFVFQPALSENFDSVSFHSEYTFNPLNDTTSFVPGVYDSEIVSHGKVAQITDTVAGNHNSLTFDYVDTISAPAVQIAFDFRIGTINTDPADGFGIGLFRKANYGVSGPSAGIVGGKAWENPTGAGGYANALFFGFGVYGTDAIRLAGPAAPATVLATVNPTFPLAPAPAAEPVPNPFNRAIITIITNGAASSMVKLEILENVDGATPTRRVIFDNVLVPGFVIANEDFRLIAGGRTGDSVSKVEIDNLTFSVPAQAAPSLVLSNTATSILGDIYDATGAAVNPTTVQATLNGASLAVTATKTGSITTLIYAGTTGGFFPSGDNTLVVTYSTATGTPFTDTRTVTTPPYLILPSALALPSGSAGAGGFNVRTVQVEPVIAGGIIGSRLSYAEGILAGVSGSPFAGGNVADLTGATNGLFHLDVINYEQEGAVFGFFDGETTVPGIPGTTGSLDNYAVEALTWVNFPSAGLYNFGVTSDDGYRLSVTHAPVPSLSIATPVASARTLAAVTSDVTSAAGGVFGALPSPPVTAKVVQALPVDATAALTNAAAIAGNIALIDRGTNSFAAKLQFAQAAGAIAAIVVNQNNPDAFPIVMGGDGPAITGVTIPGVMISKTDGDALKALLGSAEGLTIKFGPDNSTTLAQTDLNQTTTFTAAVSTPGLYPLRFMNFEGGGGANAEWYSIDALGVKHLVNDPNDPDALKSYSSISTGTAPTISLTRNGNVITIQYTGTLQSSANLSTFTDVTGATSPYIVPAGSPARLFFRARP